ncbi:hypothetical protein BDZ89DRAFT_1043566 [Hymenopellis radicata]|nr:hypothetical protein BDZ89DRAFT_1043566 [Hymenopellis radicata]
MPKRITTGGWKPSECEETIYKASSSCTATPEPIDDDLAFIVRHHRRVLDTVKETLDSDPGPWFVKACRILQQTRGNKVQRRISELNDVYKALRPWFRVAQEMSEVVMNATVQGCRDPAWMDQARQMRAEVLGYCAAFQNILHCHTTGQLKSKLQHNQLPSYELMYPLDIDELPVFMPRAQQWKAVSKQKRPEDEGKDAGAGEASDDDGKEDPPRQRCRLTMRHVTSAQFVDCADDDSE